MESEVNREKKFLEKVVQFSKNYELQNDINSAKESKWT